MTKRSISKITTENHTFLNVHIVVGMLVPKMYNFIFLLVLLIESLIWHVKEETCRLSKRNSGKNVDPSHGHGLVTVRLSCNDCSTIYVRLHCMDTGRQPWDRCMGAVR